MNTLKISVKTKKDASLLIDLLKSLSFVIRIEPVPEENEKKTNQYKTIENLLLKNADKKLFNEIQDPVRWQRALRNEWA